MKRRGAFDDLAPPEDTPNPRIDEAIDTLMAKVGSEPADIAVKIIAQAISWEKVKHSIKDEGEGFDPDDI
jgi:hypothetical protein